MPVGDSQTIGFIDVPGHERFIRNALCGLAGTDFVLFIVAADDGVMPQTREHLAIINLLGITECAVALTKIDRVSEDEIELATEEIKEVFAPTSQGRYHLVKYTTIFALPSIAASTCQEPGWS